MTFLGTTLPCLLAGASLGGVMVVDYKRSRGQTTSVKDDHTEWRPWIWDAEGDLPWPRSEHSGGDR